MRRFPSSRGVSLAVHDYGGSGRPTLLAHATGLHGAVWEPFAAALGDGFQRWALDFRAHGHSIVPPNQPLPWTEFGEDVEAVVDHLASQPGQFLGIGHSMGGAALLLAEQAHPGTFAGLWLFEPIALPPTPRQEDRPADLAESAARRRESFPNAAAALAHYSAKPPLNTWQAAALAAYVRHGFAAGDDGAVHLACRPADEAQIFRGGRSHQAFSRLGEVHCPVVVVCGEDLLTPPGAIAETIALALPHGSLERHRFMGHFGPLEAPRTLAASVAAFAATLG